MILATTCVIALSAYCDIPDNAIGAFLSDPTDTNLRETPGGKIVKTVSHKGDYILCVCQPKNGWWQVHSISDIEGNEIEVPKGDGNRWWIHSSVIALGTRNYGNQWIRIYASPSDKSKVVFKSRKELTVTPIDIKDDGEWVKVSVTYKGKKYVGWIEGDNLCDNPVTNCC